MQLVWAPRARQLRQAAIERIAQVNPVAALNQLDKIEQQTDSLLQHPEIGRTGRKQGTRELVISDTSFLVVYRVRPRSKRIEILHFLHASQQWP